MHYQGACGSCPSSISGTLARHRELWFKSDRARHRSRRGLDRVSRNCGRRHPFRFRTHERLGDGSASRARSRRASGASSTSTVRRSPYSTSTAQYYAIADVCTHDAGQLTGGTVEGDMIVCPRHGARFCIRTGAALSAPAYEPTDTFPVRSKTARSRCATTAGIDRINGRGNGMAGLTATLPPPPRSCCTRSRGVLEIAVLRRQAVSGCRASSCASIRRRRRCAATARDRKCCRSAKKDVEITELDPVGALRGAVRCFSDGHDTGHLLVGLLLHAAASTRTRCGAATCSDIDEAGASRGAQPSDAAATTEMQVAEGAALRRVDGHLL